MVPGTLAGHHLAINWQRLALPGLALNLFKEPSRMLEISFCGLGRRELYAASLRRCFLLKSMMQDESTPRLVKLTPSNYCVFC